jgi:hypothetical protein
VQPLTLNIFAANNNNFNRLPLNVFAGALDYSFNAMVGPVVLFQNSSTVNINSDTFLAAVQTVTSINLAGQSGLRCPIELSLFTRLVSLQLQNANFSCDFYDPTQVQLPPSLTSLDVGENAWTPMILQIPATYLILRANRANVLALGVTHGVSLQFLSLDGNNLVPSSPIVGSQLQQWTTLFSSVNLISVSCRNCSLEFSLTTMMQSLKANSPLLQVLRLSQVRARN